MMFFFFQAEDGIRDDLVTGVQTCALPISHDVRLYGKPVEWRGRAAMTMVGGVMWELIQPLDDNGLFARFLAERGGGVHHIAVATPDFRRTLKEQAERGNEPILSGTFSGVGVDYAST